MLEQNKANLQRWTDAVNQGREAALAILDEMTTPDYRMHDPSGEVNGRPALREFIASLFEGMPDIHQTLEETVGEGDRVAYRIAIRGTHTGKLMGYAPTGNRVESIVISIARFQDGKLAEEWQTWDFHGFLEQLSSKKATVAGH